MSDIEHWLRLKNTNGDNEAAEVIRAAKMLLRAFSSHIDGRDLLAELNPPGWHHCDIEVRRDGQNHRYEGDWLKDVFYARWNLQKQLGLRDDPLPSGYLDYLRERPL